MVIVSFGVMKSASSYQYQILSEILHARHQSFDDYLAHRKLLVGKKYASLYYDPNQQELIEILSLVPKTDFFAYKTHDFMKGSHSEAEFSLPISISNKINRNEIKIIGSIRDPREIILSAIDHCNRTKADETNDFFSTLDNYDSTIPHIKHAFKKALAWEKTKKILWIPYDSLFEYEVEIIAAIQDVMCLHFIDIFDRIEKLKSKGIFHQYNKGVRQRWKTELTEQEQDKFGEVFKSEIDFYTKIYSKMNEHFRKYTKYVIKKKDEAVIEKKYYNIK